MTAKPQPKTKDLPPWLVELLDEVAPVLGKDKVADFKLRIKKGI